MCTWNVKVIIDEVNAMSEVSTWVEKARSDEVHKQNEL